MKEWGILSWEKKKKKDHQRGVTEKKWGAFGLTFASGFEDHEGAAWSDGM